jgi:hypothetical protein
MGIRTCLTPARRCSSSTTAALAGEILVSTNAAVAAGLDPALERRSLALKGKEDATEVVTLRVDSA